MLWAGVAGNAEASGASAVSGTVVDQQSAWSADGQRIVTTSTIDGPGGRVAVRQLGGSVDGIGMVVIHTPAIPALGATVTAVTAGDESWVQALYRGVPTPGGSIAELPPMEFTRTTTSLSGVPLHWASGCVFITYSAEGTSHIPGTQEFDAIDTAIAEWTSRTRSCGYLEVVVEAPEQRNIGFDRVNIIKFRDTNWPPPGVDPGSYTPEAGGLTTLFFVDEKCDGGDSPPCYSNPRNGEILDADIELNGVNFALSLNGQTLGSASCLSDVGNTITHELGHLFGLDHTCWIGIGPRPVDDTGQPIPSCDSPNLSSEVENATMYNFQDCGETKKISLETDDIAGFCAIYPLADDPGVCERVGDSGGCCTIAGAKTPPNRSHLLLMAIFAAMVLAQRRRLRG